MLKIQDNNWNIEDNNLKTPDSKLKIQDKNLKSRIFQKEFENRRKSAENSMIRSVPLKSYFFLKNKKNGLFRPLGHHINQFYYVSFHLNGK